MNRFLIITLLFMAACSPPKIPINATLEPITTNTSLPDPTKTKYAPSSANVIPIFYDDDGSPDGTTALLYLLSHPYVDLKAVSLSYGEVYPEIYIQHMGRMMDDFGIGEIALGYGEIPSYSDFMPFPEFLRQSSNNFWGFPIPNADKTYPAQPAPELMVSIIQQSPKPITVFVIGPCTNLAEALRIEPDIKNNIDAVYIMGGAVYAPGNVHDFYPDHDNVYAEWNFVADPRAAKEVFEAGLDMYLIPLDATNQVLVTRQDTNQWRQGGEIANFAADIYDWLLDVFTSEEAAIWDLMAAVIMLEPDLCEFTPLPLEVITENRNSLGRSAVIPEGEANISVCLEPNADLIRKELIEVFSNNK